MAKAAPRWKGLGGHMMVHCGRELTPTGARGSWVHCISTVKKQRAMNAVYSSLSFFVHKVQDPSPWDWCYPQHIVLSTSVNLIEIALHRHVQRPLVPVILDYIKLTTLHSGYLPTKFHFNHFREANQYIISHVPNIVPGLEI